MKQPYEAPKIVDERSLEVEAIGCAKTPFTSCGPVWIDRTGNRDGCYMNPNARSS